MKTYPFRMFYTKDSDGKRKRKTKKKKKTKPGGKHPQATNNYSKNKYSIKLVISFSLKWSKTV